MIKIALGNREKILILGMGIVIICVMYYRGFYSKKAATLTELREEIGYIAEKVEAIEAEYPDVDSEKEFVDKMKGQYSELSKTLVKLESELLDEVDIPELLNKLMSEARKAGVKFKSAKPGEVKYITTAGSVRDLEELVSDKLIPDKEDAKASGKEPTPIYKILPITINFNGAYDQAIAYTRTIEYMSPYLRVTGFKMTIDQEKGDNPDVSMVIAIILGKGKGKAKESLGKTLQTAEDVKRRFGLNPFRPGDMPMKKGEAGDLVLGGIMYKGGKPLAMINDKTYSVGEKVGGKQIVRIEDNMVVLRDKGREYKLVISIDIEGKE